MAAQLAAPVVLEEPVVVYKGASFKPQVQVRDGLRTASKPYGSGVEVSTATIKGILRISKPDGTTDVTRDTSVSGEGEKALTTQGSSEGLTKDAFDFYVADTVTADWDEGLHDFEAEYVDTTPTPDDVILLLIGRIDVKPKPSAAV